MFDQYLPVSAGVVYLLGFLSMFVMFGAAAIQSRTRGKHTDARTEVLFMLAAPAWPVVIVGGLARVVFDAGRAFLR